jgi:acetate---CoA ligase (ADP-forming) subunit beta
MRLLGQKAALKKLARYNISFPNTIVFNDISEIKKRKISYPIVLKIDSSQVIHKIDMGGVALNITNFDELLKAYTIMASKMKSARIKDYDFVAQEMSRGVELIIGLKKDPIFGKAIMFGLGGIFVELYKDVSFRILPITQDDAIMMINEIKGKKILQGFRGMDVVDINKIADLLVKVSVMASKEDNIQELDFNPVLADKKKICVVDAKMLVDR